MISLKLISESNEKYFVDTAYKNTNLFTGEPENRNKK